MIHCPYCDKEMEDDARFCPGCRSLLVQKENRQKPFPRILHPTAALAAIAIISAVLIAATLLQKPGHGAAGNAPAGQNPGEAGTLTSPPPDAASPQPNGRTDQYRAESVQDRRIKAGQQSQQEYADVQAYEQKVQGLLEQVNALAAEMDKLAADIQNPNLSAMSAKLKELQEQTKKMRSIMPPRSLQRTHTRLANSFAMSQRGYQNLMAYMQSGQINRLDAGRKDLENARQMKKRALDEIVAIREDLKTKAAQQPPPSEESAAPPVEEPSQPPQEQPPAQPEIQPPPRVAPPQGEQPPETGPGGPENGNSVVPENGESVAPASGDSAAPQDYRVPHDQGQEFPETEPQSIPESEHPY